MKNQKSKLFLDKENVLTLNDELLNGIKGGTDTLKIPIDTLNTPTDTISYTPSDTSEIAPNDTTIINQNKYKQEINSI